MKIRVSDKKLKRGEKRKAPIKFDKMVCSPAYSGKIPIAQNKKTDILQLIKGN